MAALVYGSPLPPEALACLQENGFLPVAPPAISSPPTFSPLTTGQAKIWAALAGQPLNAAQTEVLAIYARASRAGEGALPVETVARRLSQATGIERRKAEAHVRGAIRSFGRRLTVALDRIPGRFGHDQRSEDVFEQVPSLALFDVIVGASGEKRHKLTHDGIIAVTAALGLTEAGEAAGGIHGTPEVDDMEAVVMVGMSRLAAALLLRVQQSLGTSLDDAVKTIAAHAGAG